MQNILEAADSLHKALRSGVYRWPRISWEEIEDPSGDAYHSLLSRLLVVLSPTEIVFASGAVTGSGADANVSAGVYTADLVVQITRESGSSMTVTVRPRSALRSLEVDSAPVKTSSDWGINAVSFALTATYDWGTIPIALDDVPEAARNLIVQELTADLARSDA
ncbi:hypothetical protein ITJ57_08250 [Plantibacter sp. VKM Ac-2880]|uniref:hypothetical protein n=1 Tax=Plantibacter sp. VKM Ac-2880 TaxID=2783827 RepID=UPI00188F07EC|nr:hypothetical protein [Plantibacter sp. VKM Ac-2880]MBF4568761.1 hypothetical protein [Plantibacter sp. VKM Ac-2880]